MTNCGERSAKSRRSYTKVGQRMGFPLEEKKKDDFFHLLSFGSASIHEELHNTPVFHQVSSPVCFAIFALRRACSAMAAKLASVIMPPLLLGKGK